MLFQWYREDYRQAQVGILAIPHSIPIELCFITKQYAIKNPGMWNHPLAKLNTNIIIQLKSLHTLQMVGIPPIITYGLPHQQCRFTNLIKNPSNTDCWAMLC
jgi:hypothetical protein